MTSLEQLKYPIGKFEAPENIDPVTIAIWIDEIKTFPYRLADVVEKLSKEQLNNQYRPDGWTLRQVIHHCADSHMNAYIRFKLALTEDKPIIKPYHEDRWANLADVELTPVEVSVKLLLALHQRWVSLLQSLTPADLDKGFVHPDHQQEISLKKAIGTYAWHGNHHLAHIVNGAKNGPNAGV